MTIKYDQLSEIFFETFPEIKAMYLEDKEWYEDLTHLPHIIFGELLNPLLIELLTENKNKTEISKFLVLLKIFLTRKIFIFKKLFKQLY